MFQEPNSVQVRITIDEIKPKVWRRLVLPSHWTLEQLHLSIQAAFNWWNALVHGSFSGRGVGDRQPQ
ncbi:plasmid pRiA4b ORF-3 family protein [Neorhizobium galegae]|uniref:Plasmid pRiA4b ORF-3 family protein n=1 Tax=Neorhizobium galegae TaxID=399 RepID=A0A6A1TKE7_NEOGA|nr:plasmid pRiA4b ORF-3 family protein [Neorhizobium galegae]